MTWQWRLRSGRRWREVLALFLWLNLAAPPPALLVPVSPADTAEAGHGCCCASATACLCRFAPGGGDGCGREGAECLLSQRPVRSGEGEAPAAAPVLRLARPEVALHRPDPAPAERVFIPASHPAAPPLDPPDPPPPRF